MEAYFPVRESLTEGAGSQALILSMMSTSCSSPSCASALSQASRQLSLEHTSSRQLPLPQANGPASTGCINDPTVGIKQDVFDSI